MKKIIVTAVVIFTASLVPPAALFSSAKQNDVKTLADINTHFNPGTIRKDIGSAD